MKLIACMNLYNEIQFIRPVLAGLKQNGIDKVIAVDGAYRGFPRHRSIMGEDTPLWCSTDGTWGLLVEEALSGDRLTLIEAPPEGWVGQEVKRTAYYREADKTAEPGDWLIQVDGDEELIGDLPNPDGLRFRDFLSTLPEEVTTIFVSIRNREENKPPGGWDEWAKVYRWLPGLHYGNEHWDIIAGDGRVVWSRDIFQRSPNARFWHWLQFDHWRDARHEQRVRDKDAYTQFRNEYRKQFGCMNPNPQIEVKA